MRQTKNQGELGCSPLAGAHFQASTNRTSLHNPPSSPMEQPKENPAAMRCT